MSSPPGTNAALLEKLALLMRLGQVNRELPIKKVIAGLFKMKVFKILLVYSFLTTFLRSIFFLLDTKLLVDIGMGTSTAILNLHFFHF